MTFLGPATAHLGRSAPEPESLRKAGYFDPGAVGREVKAQRTRPRVTPRRFVYDMGLTSVVATQLWHHLYISGGLCDLPRCDAPEYAGNRVPAKYKAKAEVSGAEAAA